MNRSANRRLADAAGAVTVLASVLAVWWLATSQGWISRVFLPSPAATLASLGAGLGLVGRGPAALPAFFVATVVRMLEGWLLASAAGVAMGVTIGSVPLLRRTLQPTLEFLRPLPASALLPLAISIFGLGGTTVLAVVALGAMWPVLLATLHGLGAVEPRLAEVARSLQLSRAAMVWKIGLPNALPDILAGMRLAMTIALIVAVVGEMITSQPGLGQAILLAARSFHADDLFAGVVLLGVIGFASNAVLAFAERRLLRWQHP